MKEKMCKALQELIDALIKDAGKYKCKHGHPFDYYHQCKMCRLEEKDKKRGFAA
jgi:hypothetical protein